MSVDFDVLASMDIFELMIGRIDEDRGFTEVGGKKGRRKEEMWQWFVESGGFFWSEGIEGRDTRSV